MNAFRFRRAAIAVTAAVTLPLTLAACGGDDSSSDAAADNASSSAPCRGAAEPGGGGEHCHGRAVRPGVRVGSAGRGGILRRDGPGPGRHRRLQQPRPVHPGHRREEGGLVDTLNNAQNITVFAPTNDAFAKIPKADLDKVLADKEMLTNILTYHVVGEKLTPQALESGTFETLQKSTLATKGSGEDYTVNDNSKVVCGNVPTANATVYIVDTVLMPKA